MTKYELNRFDTNEFESFSQALIKLVIGKGTITFGPGPDGGREATYSGKAPYPSEQEQWDGEWIFQAKYHDIYQIGPDKARKMIISDLDHELNKITNTYQHRCDNYLLITNVPLSSTSKTGSHDRIKNEIVAKYSNSISNIHVWGKDDLCRFLDIYAEIRQSYLHFILPGDAIALLQKKIIELKEELHESNYIMKSHFIKMDKLMTNQDYKCPNVFTIKPVLYKKFNPSKLFNDAFSFVFYCQAENCQHPVDHEIIIKKRKNWWRKIRPFLLFFHRNFNISSVDISPDPISIKLQQQFLSDIKTTMEELQSDSSEIGSWERATAVTGPEQRALFSLLNEYDPSHEWGGLSEFVTTDGRVLWLCKFHLNKIKQSN